MKLFESFKKSENSDDKIFEPVKTSVAEPKEEFHQINQMEYFKKYIGFRMDMMNQNTINNPQENRYLSYFSLDMRFLEYLAENGNMAAREALGECYAFGLNDKPRNKGEAVKHFKIAAEAGNAQAMVQLAQIYREESSSFYNVEESLKWSEKAAYHGSCVAMNNLACAYMKGKEAYRGRGYDIDKRKTSLWNERGAEAAENLLLAFLTLPCDSSLQQDFQLIYSMFVQCVCLYAEQKIDGDGIPTNYEDALTRLEAANQFHIKWFHSECNDFTQLICEIRAKQNR